ncbi:hypothetical protein GLOIN_2v1880501 [Rhizophagus clarus]|uniref:Uncharacterized protein n=2 Tax=Rhizophagus clarus TaxID=94130 RepID=A0A8H3QGD5_9GLOM|nr:hypothetical protein GLOIN_2v1880501 [Rhizophagus clarus]
MLIGNVSAAENTIEAKVNERIRLALELENSDITINLSEYKDKKSIVHLATVISVNDLLHQIEHECPPETSIPSTQCEPEFPVAAVEKEKKVVVSKNTIFSVADYNFTKIGIVPSVAMICSIPESIDGLQSIDLMRTKMNNDSERLMSKCGTMNKIHKVAEKNPTLKENLTASLQTLINLIRSVFEHQFLKDKSFKIFTTASETEMKRF